MNGEFDNISIRGIQTVVPKKRICNQEFSSILGERRCKKQIKLTGVKYRYVSEHNQTTTDLAFVAGKTLLQNIGWNPDEIKVLVLATQNPMFALPSTAFYLQKLLNISKDCVVFDVNLGCSGAVVGIQIVSSLLQHAGVGGKGLLLVADAVFAPNEYEMSNPDAIAHQMLFGSASSAVALEVTEPSTNKMEFLTYSDGSRYRAIMRKLGEQFVMDGEAVFEFGLNDVCNGLKKFKQRFNIQEGDVDYYSFHQAQDLMLKTISNECDIPIEKNLLSLENYGNTNGSSPLITICANMEKFSGLDSINFILCGFGVGLSWSYVKVSVASSCIKPIVFSDYCIREDEL